jgi:hypothetical protein
VFSALADCIRDQAKMSAVGGCCMKMVVQTDNMITSIVVGCSIANTGQQIKLVKQGGCWRLVLRKPGQNSYKNYRRPIVPARTFIETYEFFPLAYVLVTNLNFSDIGLTSLSPTKLLNTGPIQVSLIRYLGCYE